MAIKKTKQQKIERLKEIAKKAKNKRATEGGGGSGALDFQGTATPVTEVEAAFAQADQRQAYAPMASQSRVNELTGHAQALNHALGKDVGISPTPHGTSSSGMLDTGNEYLEKRQFVSNPNTAPQSKTKSCGTNEVVLVENQMNAYITTGKINGKEVTFLLDTGATNVSIPVRIARAIGLKPTGRTHMVQTASGSVPVDEVLLETVSIGNITIEYVDASINPSDHSDKILLGMSALRKLEFTHKDGKLILRQEKNR